MFRKLVYAAALAGALMVSNTALARGHGHHGHQVITAIMGAMDIMDTAVGMDITVGMAIMAGMVIMVGIMEGGIMAAGVMVGDTAGGIAVPAGAGATGVGTGCAEARKPEILVTSR
jgi:hypothetical protein